MIPLHHDCRGSSTTTDIRRLGVIAAFFRHGILSVVP